MTGLKYRYLQTLRDTGNMFWGLFYPMILATLFFVAFGDLGKDNWTEIPVALVREGEAGVFEDFMKEVDGDLLLVRGMDEEEALKALADEEIEGIFYTGSGQEDPSLTVGKSGLRETVLSMILDAYVKNSTMMQDIATAHPEGMQDALDVLRGDVSHIREVSLGGKTYETVLEYFFACIAMMCFFGCFMGQKLGEENAANVTTRAARRSISPEKKSLAVLCDLLVGISIQFVNALVFLLFLQYVLRISLNGNLPGMALICLLGSMVGVSLGIVVGSSSHLSNAMKTLILVALPLFLCFLSGLMMGQMKYIIEERFPLLNRVNPAALISDALYFLNVFHDPRAYLIRLGLLFAFAFVMTVWAFLALRRTRYESI